MAGNAVLLKHAAQTLLVGDRFQMAFAAPGCRKGCSRRSCSRTGTFAGVGLRTNLRELGKQGSRPFIVGAVGEVVIALLTLGLVLGVDR